jgi:hypothetical protein
MFRFLRYQGCRVEGRAQARARGQQPFSIYTEYTDRRFAAMRGMRTAVVIEDHPVIDSSAGVAPTGEGMQEAWATSEGKPL